MAERNPPDHETAVEAAIIIHPAQSRDGESRSAAARLDEAIGLAEAINLEIAAAQIVRINRPRPSTLLGQGKVEEIRAALDGFEKRPGLLIIDAALSPVQHRNLEKEWDAKVLDRTALILEIFGARAQTAEGRLQVDLAHLTYQRSRLVRSWTHLERQRGGAGFLGGPGERQIESDRRALAVKIDRLKSKLEHVRRTRSLQRAKRKRAPHPVVALIGYTNAGKSTLFNRLTQSDVVAQDLLFATLDPTMRAVDLESGQRVILSDTVGFISNLPTQLVAAFRATLEEVGEADLIIHVRDASHEDTDAQRDDVIAVLNELGVADDSERPAIEALNKIDLLDANDRSTLKAMTRAAQGSATMTLSAPVRVCISAVTGEGLDEMSALIDAVLTAEWRCYAVNISNLDGAARAWLHQRGDVLGEASTGGESKLVVRLTDKTKGQFEKTFPAAFIAEAGEDLERRIA